MIRIKKNRICNSDKFLYIQESKRQYCTSTFNSLFNPLNSLESSPNCKSMKILDIHFKILFSHLGVDDKGDHPETVEADRPHLQYEDREATRLTG